MQTPHIFPWMLSALLFAACGSYYTDIDDLDATDKLVLYCMPAAGVDTTVIQLSRSQALSSSVDPWGHRPMPANVHVAYSVNGVEQKVQYADSKVGDVPSGCYYVVGTLREGDQISVEASAEGFPTVQGRTTIPPSFPLDSIVLRENTANTDNEVQVAVALSAASSVSSYAVHVVRRDVHDYFDYRFGEFISSHTVEGIYHPDMDLSSEPLLNNVTGMDEIFDVSNEFYDNLYTFTNRTFLDRPYTLRLNTRYFRPSFSKDSYDHVVYRSSYYYRVYLYRLSSEMYQYLKSVNDINNNDLGLSGLASIRSHYSNVSGGLGVVCGCNVIDTGWMPSPVFSDGVQDDSDF
jgi:hypothetical protein